MRPKPLADTEPTGYIHVEDIDLSMPLAYHGNNTNRRGERKPSLAHALDEQWNDKGVHPRAARWFVDALMPSGNTVCYTLGAGRADILPPEYSLEPGGELPPRGGLHRHRIGKLIGTGGIMLLSDDEGGQVCLVRLVRGKRVNRSWLLVSLDDAKVCAVGRKQCVHIVAEQAARRAEHERREREESDHRDARPDAIRAAKQAEQVELGVAIANAIAARDTKLKAAIDDALPAPLRTPEQRAADRAFVDAELEAERPTKKGRGK